jgi:predicted transposase YbfD/YdcC
MEVEKEKENEIVVAPKLLRCLDLRNKIVVGDAMHTQRQISTQIVKDNQPETRQAIEVLFSPELPPVTRLRKSAKGFSECQND